MTDRLGYDPDPQPDGTPPRWVLIMLAIFIACLVAKLAYGADGVIELVDADDPSRVLLRCRGPVPLAMELGTSPLAVVCSNPELPPPPPLFRSGFEPVP